MTEQRLRDLLHEHVQDLAPTDLGARAWTGARRRRQRRVAVVAGAAVATVAVVAGSLALVRGDGGAPDDPAPAPRTEQPAVGSPKAEPGSAYRGAQTWWAPSTAEERNLPLLGGTPLPAEFDLAAGASAHRPGVRAVAVFQLAGEGVAPGRVVVIGTDGASYSLDVGRLDRVTDEFGNAMQPVGDESLAPDGRHVFFRQNDSLEIYDLVTGDWSTTDTAPWMAEGARWSSSSQIWVPDRLGAADGPGTTYDVDDATRGSSSSGAARVWDPGADQPFGPARSAGGDALAQAYFLQGDFAGPPGSGIGGMAVVARRGTVVSLLVMPYDVEDDGRWKGCCPVVGWLDDRTVLLQSRSSASRILAWRVGTPDLRRVSRLVGWVPGEEVPVGSFADPR